MTTNSMSRSLAAVAVLAALGTAGCNFDITNPNTPTQIGPNPSAEQVAAAVNGVMIAARGGIGGAILREGIIS